MGVEGGLDELQGVHARHRLGNRIEPVRLVAVDNLAQILHAHAGQAVVLEGFVICDVCVTFALSDKIYPPVGPYCGQAVFARRESSTSKNRMRKREKNQGFGLPP